MLNSLKRPQNSRMMSAVVEFADPGRTPPSGVLSQVHGNLPIEDSGLGVTLDACGPQAFRYDPVDRGQRHTEEGLEGTGSQARTWEPPGELPPVSLRSRIAFAGRTDR